MRKNAAGLLTNDCKLGAASSSPQGESKLSNHETWSFGDRSQIQIDVEIADTWWGRFRGLMLRKPLPPAAGLWLNPTNSIHMCFMRFAIDAVYFNKNMEIVKIVRNLHPWLGLSACLKASSVLELKAGEAERLGLKVGLQVAGREL